MSGSLKMGKSQTTVRNERRRARKEQIESHDFKATKYRPTPNKGCAGTNEQKRKKSAVRRSFTKAGWNANRKSEKVVVIHDEV